MASRFDAVSGALATLPSAYVLEQPAVVAAVPAMIAEAGERAAFHTLEFFTARLPNANTRAAYARAVADFCQWCDARHIPLPALSSPIVAAYFHELCERLSPSSANLHLSGLRQWLEWLMRAGVLPSNPAHAVRGARLSRREGKTPVLDREQARRLFGALEGPELAARRDRALFAIMLYDLVRVSAVVRMRVRDFQDHGDAAWLVLAEKGGKQRRLLAHHVARECVREYLAAAHLQRGSAANQPLFQSVPRRAAELSGKPLDRSAVLAIVKRRCREVGLPPSICNHSFRATGITLYQEGGGDIETAARLAGHAETRTTQLYNRHERSVTGAELERIQL
jgi:integrase/recombinase XerD